MQFVQLNKTSCLLGLVGNWIQRRDYFSFFSAGSTLELELGLHDLDIFTWILLSRLNSSTHSFHFLSISYFLFYFFWRPPLSNSCPYMWELIGHLIWLLYPSVAVCQSAWSLRRYRSSLSVLLRPDHQSNELKSIWTISCSLLKLFPVI